MSYLEALQQVVSSLDYRRLTLYNRIVTTPPLAKPGRVSHHCLMFAVLMLAIACGEAPPDPTAPRTVDPAMAVAGSTPAAAVVGEVLLRPASPALAPGERKRFKTYVRTEEGRQQVRTGVVYTATGGTIDANGLYTAGARAGTYQVKAALPTGISAVSVVRIGTATDTPAPSPVPLPQPTASCLAGSGPLTTLSGVQKVFDARKVSVANQRVDAKLARWVGAGNFAVLVADAGHATPGLCWVGGLIQSGKPAGTEWREYHSTAGMWLASPGFVVEEVRIEEYGDAIRAVMRADGWTVRRSHIVNAHDDCMENDWLHSGTIEDVLYEGCYVFLSSRPGSGVDGSGVPVSAAGDTVRIDRTLVWHKPMPSVYRGPAPGTGPLFKWSPEAEALTVVITNSIFRVDQLPNHGDLKLPPRLAGCSNNVVVWLGTGRYPETLPPCFTVTTDRGVWDRAVAEWKARHP